MTVKPLPPFTVSKIMFAPSDDVFAESTVNPADKSTGPKLISPPFVLRVVAPVTVTACIAIVSPAVVTSTTPDTLVAPAVVSIPPINVLVFEPPNVTPAVFKNATALVTVAPPLKTTLYALFSVTNDVIIAESVKVTAPAVSVIVTV